jgi:glycoprotein-N-acetylgalactosamine 3-beta-galactosyltransferase
VELGLSLQRVGILTEDTRDADGRARFISLGLSAERVLSRTKDSQHWFWKYEAAAKEGKQCCSKRWIGTHYVPPEEMRQLEDLHAIGCEGAGRDPY